MQARYALWLVRKWLWLIILAALIGGAVGLAFNLFQPKMYESSTILYVSSADRTDYQSVLGAQQVAKSLALFPQSDEVLNAALTKVGVGSLSLSQLSSAVTVVNAVNSQFVTIDVRNTDPQLAARFASEITKQSITLFMASQSGFQVAVVQQADIPQGPVGMGPAVVLAIGMLVGLVVIVCIILFLEQTNGILVIRLGDQITVLDQETGLPTVITLKELPTAGRTVQTVEGPDQEATLKLRRIVIPQQVSPLVIPETPRDSAALNGLDPQSLERGSTEVSES